LWGPFELKDRAPAEVRRTEHDMSASERLPMTRAGAAALKEELKRLKTVERPKIIEALAEARSHGDLSENADYDAAKHQQSFNEGRILHIEDKLSRSEVVDVSKFQGSTKVLFGATVTIADEEGAKTVYQIVGDIEADFKKGRISISSPIARALIGREQGDSVTVRGPKGNEKEYEILAVAYVDEYPQAEES
jgi:transcription elongation factor GreA